MVECYFTLIVEKPQTGLMGGICNTFPVMRDEETTIMAT